MVVVAGSRRPGAVTFRRAPIQRRAVRPSRPHGVVGRGGARVPGAAWTGASLSRRYEIIRDRGRCCLLRI